MMRKFLFLYMACLCCLVANAQADRQLIRSGNRSYRHQNFAKAEAEYRKALDAKSDNTQALYNLGCALMMQQKDSMAVDLFEKAGRLEKSKMRKAMVYHNIGVICQNRKLFGEADKAYAESLRNNPNDNETRYNYVLCKRLLKNQKKNSGGQNKPNQDKDDNGKNKQNQKDQKKKQQQQQQKEQMSQSNAEQLLNAVMQEEKNTQQRLKKQSQQNQSRRLQKNW